MRQALVGVADGLALDGAVLADAKMAVTEACTNAVVHAYDDDDGPPRRRDVRRRPRAHRRRARQGLGHPAAGQPHAGPTALGLGLPLIAALSDAFEVRGGPGIGTEVRMTFTYERDADPADENPITGGPGPTGRWELDDEASPSADGNGAAT